MSALEEAREQAREALTTISKRMAGSRLGKSTMREMDADILALRAADATIRALLDATEPQEAVEPAEGEREAYKRAKDENDERFMRERDEARRERDDAVKEMHARELHHFEVEEERDRLAAVIEGTLESLRENEDHDVEVIDILESADTSILREVLAKAWDEGMAYGVNYDAGDYGVAPEPIENPYRTEQS